jgi:hypothetical protein
MAGTCELGNGPSGSILCAGILFSIICLFNTATVCYIALYLLLM